PSRVRVGPVECGPEAIAVAAGPRAGESPEPLMETAQADRHAGAALPRGGACKPRTALSAFQALAEAGRKPLAHTRAAPGPPRGSDVVGAGDVELVASYADMLQNGARNVQNVALLREVGRSGMPGLLKRGLSATIEEWLMAAEYIMSEGNHQVVL